MKCFLHFFWYFWYFSCTSSIRKPIFHPFGVKKTLLVVEEWFFRNFCLPNGIVSMCEYWFGWEEYWSVSPRAVDYSKNAVDYSKSASWRLRRFTAIQLSTLMFPLYFPYISICFRVRSSTSSRSFFCFFILDVHLCCSRSSIHWAIF